MQPLENKRTKIQSGVARARILLQRDAAWLPGYPLGVTPHEHSSGHRVPWASAVEFDLEKPRVWMIDGEHLRQAQMTISKLRHNFPRALPKLVGDVDDWLTRIDFLFELLKDAVHEGINFGPEQIIRKGVLPRRWMERVVRMKSTYPSLVRLIDAVTFSNLSDREGCQRDSIDWIELHAEPLGSLCALEEQNPCELPLLLLSVREEVSPELLNGLIRCLTNPWIRDCQWENMNGSLTRLKRDLKKAMDQNEYSIPSLQPSQNLHDLVRTVLYRVYSQRPKKRRQSFRLLEQILTIDLVEALAETQLQISEREKSLRRLIRKTEANRELIPNTKTRRNARLEKETADLAIASKEIAVAKALGNSLLRIQQDSNSKTEPWIRFLANFPRQHAGLRVRLLANWKHEWYAAEDKSSDLHRLIDALSSLFLRRGIAACILRHWYEYVDGNHTHTEFVVDTCYELQGNSALVRRTVSLLEKAVYDHQLRLGPKLMTSLVELAQATEDDALSVSILELLTEHPDRFYTAASIRLAIRFGQSPNEMSQVLMSIQENDNLKDLATELNPLVNDPELRRIVAKRLADKRTTTLSRIAATAGILNDLDHPLPKREIHSHPPEWSSRYPSEYQTALKSLHESTPESETIADNILGKLFPSPYRLQAQIDAVEAKLTDGVPSGVDEDRLKRRMQNLQRLKKEGARISPARRDNLVRKLLRRAEEEMLERYAKQCQEQAVQATSHRFGIQKFPEELLSPPMDRVLREISRLDKPMRQLGIRLLFESLHRTTRPFDDEPKNVAFARRMESRGIDIGPWLSKQLGMELSTSDGTPYEIAFTRDVVDFLLMGFHFDTCLSPDSCNFFSTVANAVDLNKRVVYGKTATGKVIGRCLFALNDDGEILTYYRYSHDSKDGFSDAVDEFARRLARDMNTSVASGGKVSNLVASDWYDDGPMGDDLHWLGEGGALSELMKQVPSKRLLTELVDEVGENVLRQRMVEVATDERLRRNSDFLHAFIDQFGGQMSVRQRFTIAMHAEPTGVRNRLLTQLRWSEIVRLVHRHQCDECDVFHGIADYARVFRVLSEHNPTLGLRAIRAARPHSIRDDLSDPNIIRKKALANVHEQLGRHHLAEQLRAR